MKTNSRFLKFIGFLAFVVLVLAALGCALLGPSIQSDTVEEPDINEASGLASSIKTPGLLYTHNDSGGEAAVYVLNKHALMPAVIVLDGVKNRDWEDISTCIDPKDSKPYVYVGDIGDNNANHTSSFIYRFEEPEILDTLITISKIDKIEFTYEDGPRDAEALFVDPLSGDIYVISKRDENSGIYRLPYPQSFSESIVAKRIGQLPYSWVVAADISPSGKHILVKTYTNIYRYTRKANQSIAEALSTKGKIMPYKLEPQGESVAFDEKGKGYFTISERLGETPVELYYYK
ncbi:MAG: hypothetical protein GXY81_01500 [Candidatus Cloacimonetes bacterium]|nr:hypothetical protein [Candidatus Cloacimonadota bacterium]